ncbi:Os02g0496400 [Oryza sativa Japonica Group]|uniref:Os02g0496400 protein n=1 Tax=Oryza sativa subsp. japonica TaxID=39947 RepID=A0A0P0VJC8_ORYSJ|nr:Os02g0496400 [Oryza sativa Japonica Group]
MNIDLNLALQEDEECGEEHGLRQDDVQDEEYGNAALQLDLNLQAEEEKYGKQPDEEQSHQAEEGEEHDQEQIQEYHVTIAHDFDLNMHDFDLNMQVEEEDYQDQPEFESYGEVQQEQEQAPQDQEYHGDATRHSDVNMQVEEEDYEYQPDDDFAVYANHVDIGYGVELEDSGGGQDNIDHDVSHVEHESVTTSTRTWLIDEDRQHVLDACFADSENLKLKRDTTTIVASLFNIKKSLVQSIWRKAKHCHAEGVPLDLTSKKEKCGRHRVEVDLSLVPTIPLNRRTTIRDIASELHVSKSTMHRSFKDGKLCQESNTIKPLLKDENKEGHVMNTRGGNGYMIPHRNKEGMELHGVLPTRLSFDPIIYESAMQTLAR